MKKNVQFTSFLTIFILLLTACGPVSSLKGFPTIVPGSTDQPKPTRSAVRQAQVSSLEIKMNGTAPVQVNVVVRGNLSESCAKLGDTQLSYASNTFMVTLASVSPADRGCAQIITPFELTIPLDTTGLGSGEYTVKVNGVSAVFTLPASDSPTVVPVSSEGTGQLKTFSSSLYGYKVSYPASWSININTAVASQAGSNPEYVTFTTNSANHLPRIDIEVLTGKPPMVGYEECVKNFVFRTLPACQISLPAGQNPAAEVWVFQNGTANFFIAMQYEEADSLRLFNDFLSSFEFIQ